MGAKNPLPGILQRGDAPAGIGFDQHAAKGFGGHDRGVLPQGVVQIGAAAQRLEFDAVGGISGEPAGRQAPLGGIAPQGDIAAEIAVQKGQILVDLFYETYAESVINGAIQVNVYVVD